MGGDMRYEIGQNAFIKLVLQALNHKASAVNGLLLGRLSAYNNDVVEITESVPLFHSQIDLLPPLEIALIQAMSSQDRRKILLDIADAMEANENLITVENEADVAAAHGPVEMFFLLEISFVDRPGTPASNQISCVEIFSCQTKVAIANLRAYRTFKSQASKIKPDHPCANFIATDSGPVAG
ncbi:hypothetical protein RHGRI_016333 [Rhododendron griersonianum]|uniref:Uncharacterized protein n=1 Tax=Rhododendron griersonianum TaxID=479676 RepID=A0AAV6JTR6_9ERIC|nr:hypothetical protein RHGRI_016333 [Rhododendron griersonianum]